MKSLFSGFARAALVCGTVILSSLTVQAAPDANGFTALFNGKDLSGWEGDSRLWSVRDGAIVGSTHANAIGHNHFLSTTVSYSDFVLRAKVKLENHNSGIQFRSEQRDDYVVAGYQADIAEHTYFGMLYEEQKRGFMPYWEELSQADKDAIQGVVKHGDWNEFEITCRSDRIKMTLNGHTTVDISDPDGAKEGIIALQLHTGEPMRVAFKDIAIKELDSELLMPDYDSFRRREILESIMYPSRVISDQYSAVDVELRDGRFITGMIAGENENTLTLITTLGVREELRKSRIVSRDESAVSIMPEGLLETMGLGELVELTHFLERGANLDELE